MLLNMCIIISRGTQCYLFNDRLCHQNRVTFIPYELVLNVLVRWFIYADNRRNMYILTFYTISTWFL